MKTSKYFRYNIFLVLFIFLSINFSNAIIFEDNYGLMQFMNSSKIDNNILFPQENFIFTIPKKVSVDEISLFNVEIEKVDLYCVEKEELIYSFDYETDFVDWENQRLTAFDLGGLDCSEFSFQMKFKDNGIDKIIEKKVRLYNTEVSPDFILSKIDNLKSDEGKAQMIYALNGFSSFNTIRETLISDLKDSRDETDKCWPKNNCSLSTTTKILYYLKISGLSDNRIYEDARIWLFSNSKIQLYDQYNLEINKDEDEVSASCEITINDKTDVRTTSQDKYVLEIEPIYPTVIDVECDPSNTDVFLQGVEDFSFLEGKNELNLLESDSGGDLEYSMPKPCLINEKGYCDIESTFYFLFLDIEDNVKENIFRFFSKYLRNEGYDKVYFNAYEIYNLTQDDNINYLWTSLFYYSASTYPDQFEEVVGTSSQTVLDNIKNWLFYNQNNDGSWGQEIESNEYSIDFTSKIIDYLVKSEINQNENLNDAKQYILDYVSQINSVENYANFYNMIKSDFTPFLNFDPIFLKIKDSLDVTLKNPTPYIYENMILELSLDDLLISTYNTQNRQFVASKYLKIEYMASKESNKINIIRNELFVNDNETKNPEIKFGYINVYLPTSNLDDNVFKNVDFDSQIKSKTITTNYYEFEDSLEKSKESKDIKYDLEDYILITQIPLVYINDPIINLNLEIEDLSYDGKIHTVVSGETQVDLECNIESLNSKTYNFEIDSNSKTNQTTQISKEILLDYIGENNKETLTTFTLECTPKINSDYFSSKEIEVSKNILIYESSPYEIESEEKITEKNHIISITNKLDESQTIIAQIIQNDQNYFSLDKETILLEPYETRQITLINDISKKKYSVSKIIIQFSGENKEKILELKSNVNLDVYEKEQQELQEKLLEEAMNESTSKDSTTIPIIIISIIIIITIAIVFIKKKKIKIKFISKVSSFFTKKQKKNETKETEKKTKDNKEDDENLSEEQKELVEVIKIMQSMNKSEISIKEELKKQDFKELDINKSFNFLQKELEKENESKN